MIRLIYCLKKLPKNVLTSVSFVWFFLVSAYPQQSITVTGNVKDSNSQVLQGVNVQLKNTDKSTVTDSQGFYKIDCLPGNVLVFSYMGMQTQEVTITEITKNINVVLIREIDPLDEVVVVGYTTVNKRDLTGAISQANVEDMSKAPVGSFAEALSGRIAGVQVNSADGQPGGGVNIVIRGLGSLTQSTSPLYVIDGFPIEDLDPATLNTNDIHSITVLKDASSTAIYGSRAANGVVLIEMKKGKSGRPTVEFTGSNGFQMHRKKMELMSPYEFVKYQLERFPASGAKYLREGVILEDYKHANGVDMQDHLFTQGPIGNYTVALRGGNPTTKYSVSGNYFDQQGIIINTGTKKYIGRANLEQSINPKMKVNISTGYSNLGSWGQVINSNPANQASSYVMFRAWAYRPVLAPDENIDLVTADADEAVLGVSDYRLNPLVDLTNQNAYTFTNLFDVIGNITYDVSKKWNLKVAGGTRRNSYRVERFNNSKTMQGTSLDPNNRNGMNGYVLNINTNQIFSDNTLTFKQVFAKAHRINAVALMSFQKNISGRNGYSSRLIPNEEMGFSGLDLGTPYSPVQESGENTRASFGGRVDYSYFSRYLLTMTFRADGSSKFPSHNQWGYFPGAAIAWNMKEERWLKQHNVLSNSKLRLSYGVVGNDRVSDFASFAKLEYEIDGYSFNNATPFAMARPISMANHDLTWERTTSFNLGYDLGLWKNRVQLTTDIYKRSTENLLLDATLPPNAGFGSAFKNIGGLENKGIEFTLNTVNIKRKSFDWTSSFNITFNRNKILALNDGQRALTNAVSTDLSFTDFLYRSEIGRPIGMMVGYVWEGNYQYRDFDNPAPGVYVLKADISTNGKPRNTIQPGDIKYKDLNNDGVVNSDDRTYIGRGQPIHTGGLNNNITYKQFSLNLFFQWSYGNDIYNGNRVQFEGNPMGRVEMNQFASFANRWSPENQTNANPRAGGEGIIGYHSSKYVEDGSYLRLKTAMLNYSLPSKWIHRMNMTGISVNMAVQNLFTWTRYSGLDPEVSTISNILTPGYDFSSYPRSRTVVLGLKVIF